MKTLATQDAFQDGMIVYDLYSNQVGKVRTSNRKAIVQKTIRKNTVHQDGKIIYNNKKEMQDAEANGIWINETVTSEYSAQYCIEVEFPDGKLQSYDSRGYTYKEIDGQYVHVHALEHLYD